MNIYFSNHSFKDIDKEDVPLNVLEDAVEVAHLVVVEPP